MGTRSVFLSATSFAACLELCTKRIRARHYHGSNMIMKDLTPACAGLRMTPACVDTRKFSLCNSLDSALRALTIGGLLAFLVAAIPSFAQTLSAAPPTLDFGQIRQQSSSKLTINLVNQMGDENTTVTSVSILGTNSQFSVPISILVPFTLRYGATRRIELLLNKGTSGTFKDTLRITYGRARTLDIPLAGERLCTDINEDCAPVRNLCYVDQNLEGWVSQGISDISKQVGPALELHRKEHQYAVSTYELAGDYFWKALGLSELIAKPVRCCESCAGNECLPEIQFKRSTSSRGKAKFVWDLKTPRVFDSLVNPLGVDFKIQMPAQVIGTAVVAAGGIEYFFSGPSRPIFTYKFDNKPVFSGEIECFAPTLGTVTVRHAAPTSLIPQKHLLFIEK